MVVIAVRLDDKIKKLADRYRVVPGSTVSLCEDYDPGDTAEFKKPDDPAELMAPSLELLAEYQDRLYAENTRSLLIIIQAKDAGGKDSAIKHVMSGVNPQGCQVVSFKEPSVEELDHDYLWRAAKALPPRGWMGIFNRSYYEEVLVVRVHPEILDGQQLPQELKGKGIWKRRFQEINDFERYLVDNGTEVVKLFLYVSKKEQKERFLNRIDRPDKQWKFSWADVEERARWDEYTAAYEAVLSKTSTDHAPWYVVPADHKWFTRTVVSSIIAQKLISMDPQYPTLSDEQRAKLAAAKERLLAEGD